MNALFSRIIEPTPESIFQHWLSYFFLLALDSNLHSPERRLIELRIEHGDLDAVIAVLIIDGHHDELQLRRLKKRKLQLKDYITLLKMQLVPDVPA